MFKPRLDIYNCLLEFPRGVHNDLVTFYDQHVLERCSYQSVVQVERFRGVVDNALYYLPRGRWFDSPARLVNRMRL